MKTWEEFISEVKYKPNVKIAYVDHYLTDGVLFVMTVSDVKDPSKPIEIRSQYFLPSRSTFATDEIAASYFQSFIHDCVRHLEDHETDEWLTFDGVRVFDPHK